MDKHYKSRIKPQVLKHWKTRPKHARFKFGDNTPIPVTHIQSIPIQLKNKIVFYEAHIVPGKCPALVGLASMRRIKPLLTVGRIH